ncbi:DUF3156 family protein [Pseudomonas sp. X10]
MLANWRELFSARRAPAGYRPGVTLQRLRRNLGLERFHMLDAARAELVFEAGGRTIQVSERTEAQLLMHLVMTEFQLTVPARQQGRVRFEVRHTGALKRNGLACAYRGGDRALFEQVTARLLQDSTLQAALMPLDFKRLLVECRDAQWQVTLEHIGGSEVVNRVPSFRRYIALSAGQRVSLQRSLAALEQALLAA